TTCGGAHLSAVGDVAANHPGLLARFGFLRPAARGRVPGRSANPGLPPLPGRLGDRLPYSSPSTRVAVRAGARQWARRRTRKTGTGLSGNALIDPRLGGRQRVGRDRRAGRRSGERERDSHWRSRIALIARPPTLAPGAAGRA